MSCAGFNSHNSLLTASAARHDGVVTVSTEVNWQLDGITMYGTVTVPEGDGPFPAVVYLHGCGGLGKGTLKHFSELFTGWGYAVLAVDSFATRGIKEACDRPMPDRVADAWGALHYLSQLPFIDRHRIAVVGSSQGAIIALELLSKQDTKLFDIPDRLNFRAAVAFYPICSFASEQLTAPTLILIGELDDWASAKNCQQWFGLRKAGGPPVKLVVYPGAYHDFDRPTVRGGMRLFGHWLKYDPDAAQKSTDAMREFLAGHLSK